MKKLEDIPKKEVFRVPDGYFDRLPGVIQARVSTAQEPAAVWLPRLSYALPVVLLVAIGIFWYRSSPTVLGPSEVTAQLETIQAGQLASFLEDRELTDEELVDAVTWSSDDLQALENSVYSAMDVSNKELEKIIDEYDEL